MKPTFPPFEVHTGVDGVQTSTWRHPDGSTEQWRGDEFVYGPNPPVAAVEEPSIEPEATEPAEVPKTADTKGKSKP